MLIGIDGGGTKTALVLTTSDGHILNRYTGEATNPADIGVEECAKRLEKQLDALLKDFGGREAEIESIYAGIAGSANDKTRNAVYAHLSALLPNCRHIDNGSDAFNALYGESDDGYGITLIAGTGSSSFVLTESGMTQVGGWGYLVDDAGSGYSIGHDALKAAYRSYDGRGEKTMLEEMCLTKLGINFRDAIPQIYEGGKHYIASFARVAFDAFEKGDKIAASIIYDAAEALASHLHACLTHVTNFPTVCVAAGGVISNDRFFEIVREKLGDDLNRMRILRPVLPPVYGALVKAARDVGISTDKAFKETFMKDFE
ncbi:MAG: hypothetical protein IIW08_00285 [Clostridia bacterium]|nr:hypothetical protein [Clostridia bacterium]MBQ2433117.1 hypothetical protein [Clostridia bacterium]MBQ5769593.1 hypothetical protein [Clostridia bacterium]